MAINSFTSNCYDLKKTSSIAQPITEVKYETLLSANSSWDGTPYDKYPTCPPMLSVLKITVPANTTVAWHRHPIIIVGYMCRGTLTIEKKESNEKIIFSCGEVIPEVVNVDHRVITGDEYVELLVFYAGGIDIPLSILSEI